MIQYSVSGKNQCREGQALSEDQRDQAGESDVEQPSSRTPPRNPFAEPELPDDERPPALIDTRRSAAVSGVVVGLVALFFVVAICALASIAFG